MDLWRATLTQQRVRWCSTSVTNIWCQRGGWEPCVLTVGGGQTLLLWAALKVHVNKQYMINVKSAGLTVTKKSGTCDVKSEHEAGTTRVEWLMSTSCVKIRHYGHLLQCRKSHIFCSFGQSAILVFVHTSFAFNLYTKKIPLELATCRYGWMKPGLLLCSFLNTSCGSYVYCDKICPYASSIYIQRYLQ